MPFIPFRKEGQLSIGELQEQMNQLFSRVWHAGISTGPLDGHDWAPLLDAYETHEQYVVKAEVPGLRVDDIDVTYTGMMLTVSGEKPTEPADELARDWLCRERRFGQFSRSVTLPEAVEVDQISATCCNGVLRIVLPKAEQSKTRSIRVPVEEEPEATTPEEPPV